MKLHIVVIGAAAFGLLTMAGAARAMPASPAGVVADGNANLVQAHIIAATRE